MSTKNFIREDLKELFPDETKHQFFLDIQPKLGVTLRAQGRTQINVQLYDYESLEAFQGLNNSNPEDFFRLRKTNITNLREYIYPLLWMSEGMYLFHLLRNISLQEEVLIEICHQISI